MYIAIRVAHGSKLQLQPHHVYNLVRGVGLAFPHECFKLLPVPLPRLLQRGAVPRCKQQAYEIPYAFGNYVNVFARRVHGAYRKHRVRIAEYAAEVYSVHSCPAYYV